MKLLYTGEHVALPSDPEYMDRRLRELEALCIGALMKLPPEDQANFCEFCRLLQQREVKFIQLSFQSGVRVGERRALRPTDPYKL